MLGAPLRNVQCEVWGIPVALAPGDLTRAGLFVPSPTAPPLDSELQVRLLLEGEVDVLLRALVVQVVAASEAAKGRRPGYGVLFQDLGAAEMSAVARLLAVDAGPAASAPAPCMDEPATPDPGPLRRRPRRQPMIHRTAISRDASTSMTAAEVQALRPTERGTAQPRDGRIPSLGPAPDQGPLLAELRGLLAGWRDAEPWRVLGLRRSATPDAVERAFLEHARRYHPHRFARHDSGDITDAATELFKLVQCARDACVGSKPPPKPRRAKRQRSRATTTRAIPRKLE